MSKFESLEIRCFRAFLFVRKHGCAAEVSIASWCWFKDWCKVTWVTYDNGPAMTCPKC